VAVATNCKFSNRVNKLIKTSMIMVVICFCTHCTIFYSLLRWAVFLSLFYLSSEIPVTLAYIINIITLRVATITWFTATEYLCNKWPWICTVCRNHNPVLSSFMTYLSYYQVCSTTGAICSARTAYHSGAHKFTPFF
jgi:hypothetical protein